MNKFVSGIALHGWGSNLSDNYVQTGLPKFFQGWQNLLLCKFLLLFYCFRTNFRAGEKFSGGKTASGGRPPAPHVEESQLCETISCFSVISMCEYINSMQAIVSYLKAGFQPNCLWICYRLVGSVDCRSVVNVMDLSKTWSVSTSPLHA